MQQHPFKELAYGHALAQSMTLASTTNVRLCSSQGPAVHQSATCTVYLATDIGGNKANREAVRARLQKRKCKSTLTKEEEQQLENKLVREADRVALKVMTELDQFHRELSVRGLNATPTEWWVDKNYVKEVDGSSTLDDEHVVNVIRSHKVRRHVRS
jgi:hypothetical protein